MDAKLSVLDSATRARLLLHQLDSEDLTAILAGALRRADASKRLSGRAHQLALPLAERTWTWVPLIIGIEPIMIGEE